jgi:TonB family protein
MSCNDVASVLDTHRNTRLTLAERARIDAHLSGCADCAAAWHAQTELLALRVPPVSATLLDRALRAARAQPSPAPRRPRAVLIGATALLAGAALAGIAVVSLTDPPSADTAAVPPSATPVPATAAPATAAPATSASVPVVPAAAGTPQPSDGSIAVELINTGGPPVPFLRILPNYPPDALAENLQGNVIIESTVTATGEVEDAHAVEATDARFEAAALDAFVQWKYLPRIVAGKRVATEGVRTTIRFQTAPTPTGAGIERALDPAAPGLPFDSAAFGVTMLTAWQRVIADDLRGAELALDEFRATYALPPFTEGEIWNAYGYVYTLQGSYDSAIRAYENAIGVFARSGSTQGRWVELANLYFARNQYDLALNTLLRPQRATNDASRRLSPEAQALLDKLRALGITEDTVEAR